MPDLGALTGDGLGDISADQLRDMGAEFLDQQAAVRRENQIRYYQAASPAAEQVHFSTASIIGVGGGNRASKTETCLVESIALATGVFPRVYDAVFREKFRGPINVRICIESLTTVLHPTLLPKLMWWRWSGIDQPGGLRGHWGWVPRACLKDGSWDKSWSEKLRILTVLCRDPDDPERVLGESQIQILSYDQDATDYASGTFHIVHMDEPPPYAIWRENAARVLDVAGRTLLSMTWPDDPSISVDWIYDEVYERGLPGPLKDREVDWIELNTLENQFLDPTAVLARTRGWSEESIKVKIEGQPLRFSHRVHPLFTDVEHTWCFLCRRSCVPQDGYCSCERKSVDIQDYVHVEDFEVGQNWPVVFVIDPHPRKPHMMLWVAVDPSDDYHIIQEGEVEGDAPDVKVFVSEIEESMGLDVRLRLMDPNMGRSPTSRRDINWQDEFDNAGLCLDLADDSDVGRARVNNLLEPDHHTRRPRLVFHSRCRNAATQMKRHVWDDFRRSADREQKQVPKKKYDDYPTMLKYFANYEPTFRTLYAGAPILTRPGTRKGGY
jgi:hypothetical protein